MLVLILVVVSFSPGRAGSVLLVVSSGGDGPMSSRCVLRESDLFNTIGRKSKWYRGKGVSGYVLRR
jgi:hypothetical protein